MEGVAGFEAGGVNVFKSISVCVLKPSGCCCCCFFVLVFCDGATVFKNTSGWFGFVVVFCLLLLLF